MRSHVVDDDCRPPVFDVEVSGCYSYGRCAEGDVVSMPHEEPIRRAHPVETRGVLERRDGRIDVGVGCASSARGD